MAAAALPRCSGRRNNDAAPTKKKRSRRLVIMVSVPVMLARGRWLFLAHRRALSGNRQRLCPAGQGLALGRRRRPHRLGRRAREPGRQGRRLLFTIDPEPYRIALAQADAALATARVNVEQLKVAYGTARRSSRPRSRRSHIRQAAFDRKKALVEGGNASDATLDDVKLALEPAATP